MALLANGGRRNAVMLFEKMIKMGSGFITQPGGNFQNRQLGIGQQFFCVGELDAAPIRNNGCTHIISKLLLNIGVAVGNSFNQLRDLLAEIVWILHGKHQSIQPFREIVVKLGTLMQHTGAQQLHNHRFADHQVAAGGAFSRRLDIKTSLFDFGDHSIGGFKCQRPVHIVQH